MARVFFRYVMPLLVLAVAVIAALALLQSRPQAKQQTMPRTATLVDVKPVFLQVHKVTIEAMGTVQPAQIVELRPQVSGEILKLDPRLVPGGILDKGEMLARIDPTDYELNLRQLRSDVAGAEADLKVEQGNQMVARLELELLGEAVSDEELTLMLRQPQLETLQAALDAARTRLARAQFDLDRTRLYTPFDAVVISRDASIGSRVSETTALATLVGTDEYWIETLVPVSQLRWLKIPARDGEHGSLARVYDQAAWGSGAFREGEVLRLSASLEEQGRMARLLVRISDPLGLREENSQRPRLLLNSYVRVEIVGEALPASVAIDRAHLREDDRVWVLTDDQRLEIRPVEIIFRGRNRVYVTRGLESGERLIVSEIAAPAAGMLLRTRDQDAAEAGDRRSFAGDQGGMAAE